MSMIVYRWEGPRTFVRPRVTRGSAAGSSLAGSYGDNHVMAGYDGEGNPVGLCGVRVSAFPRMSEKLRDEHLCPRCERMEAGR